MLKFSFKSKTRSFLRRPPSSTIPPPPPPPPCLIRLPPPCFPPPFPAPSFSTKSLEDRALWKKFPCPICGLGFNSPTAIKEHMSMVHKRMIKNWGHKCGCGIKFSSKEKKNDYQGTCVACQYPSMAKCRYGETEKYRERLKKEKAHEEFAEGDSAQKSEGESRRNEERGSFSDEDSNQAKMSQEEMKKKVLANTYGAAFWMKILTKFHRPAGAIPSSFVGLEAFTGTLEGFGFEDYLNDPRDSESFRPVDMHHGMEVRLGLSKGPPCPRFM